MHLDERWADILAQFIVHSLVAALFVEALARTWDVRHPAQRMALRVLALGYPLALFPALVLLFPARLDASFREVALLSGHRWHDVPFLGLDLYRVFVIGLASLGVALFLLDLGSLVAALRRARPRAATPDPASGAALDTALRALAGLPGGPPPVAFLDREGPALFCAGVRRPCIYVSRGAVALLDPEELRAALAHEAAHLERRDPERSWVVMGLRALMCLNPTFQVQARVLARDAERRADERGAELGADRLALASGLIKLHRATGAGASRRTLVFGGALAGPVRRARSRDVEQRARALLAPPPPRLPFGRLRVALAGAALTAVLYFVV
jgi:Zn-dependent protease with chaperone function